MKKKNRGRFYFLYADGGALGQVRSAQKVAAANSSLEGKAAAINVNSAQPGKALGFIGKVYKAGGERTLAMFFSAAGNILTLSGPLELSGRIMCGATGFMVGAAIGAIEGPLGMTVGAVFGADLLGGKGAGWGRNADAYWGFSDGNLY